MPSSDLRYTLWTEAWMQGEGIACQGIGIKELGDELLIHANGMEWDVVIVRTQTSDGANPIWTAIDKPRYEAWLKAQDGTSSGYHTYERMR